MKAKHAKTLQAIFALPTRASIAFGEIEALLMALGAEKTEREGSRVKFTRRGVAWSGTRTARILARRRKNTKSSRCANSWPRWRSSLEQYELQGLYGPHRIR